MDFKYAMVARGTTPLAEYNLDNSTNNRQYAIKILDKVDPNHPNLISEKDGNVICTLTDLDRITFLVSCNKTVAPSTRTAFLEDVQRKWRQLYGNRADGFAADSKNDEFGKTELAKFLNNYNNDTTKKLNEAKRNLAATEEKMNENIAKAFTRGDQLEEMEKKAENIKDSAQTFEHEATQLKRAMCCQKWRWYMLGAFAVLIVILILVVIICGGFTFRLCR